MRKKYFTSEDRNHARAFQASASKKRRLRKGLCGSCSRRRDRKDRLQCQRCRRKWNADQKQRYRSDEAVDRAKKAIQRAVRKLTRAIGREQTQAFVRKAAA